MASQGYEKDEVGENWICFPRDVSPSEAVYASIDPKDTCFDSIFASFLVFERNTTPSPKNLTPDDGGRISRGKRSIFRYPVNPAVSCTVSRSDEMADEGPDPFSILRDANNNKAQLQNKTISESFFMYVSIILLPVTPSGKP